ncbi:MAG: ROK family protein, partial [Planctomycetaceae bacterium]|nr:ROK family protein [Planctomycetaceae bacterium]
MSRIREFIPRAQAEAPFFAGIDLGGTNIKIGVVDNQGRTLSWHTAPTQSHLGAEDGARRMGEGALRAIREAGLEPQEVARVGLGSPGTMDVPAGMLLEPHNLGGWRDFPIRDRVSHHCGLPVSFANDA